jgi:pimeloyl-ACP methyl ester carboxylesterase
MRPTLLLLGFLGVTALGLSVPQEARAACGGDGDLACIIGSACDPGHRQYLLRCWEVEAEGFPSYCGGTEEPACDIAQQLAWGLGKACKSDRREHLGTCYLLEGSEGFPDFCGGTNEPACALDMQIGWGIRSCKTGRVEDPGVPVGTCRAIDGDGWPATCGGTNEPACQVDIIGSLLATTGNLIGACKSGLIQQGSPTNATCVAFDADGFPPFCGDIGERACLLTEHIPSCKRGAIESLSFPVGECVPDGAFIGMTDFSRPDPSDWSANELPPGPRTIFFIHGKGGSIEPDTYRTLLTALAEAGHTIYGADYNASNQVAGASFEIRPFVYDAAAAEWGFSDDGSVYGDHAIDGTNFYLQEVAGWLAEAILDLDTGPHIAVIGSSMGGLIARHLVYRHYDDLRFAGKVVAEVITLGTPHAGGGFGVAGVTGPAGIAGYVVQERFGCTGRFEPGIGAKELRHRYQTCLMEMWQVGRAAVQVPIDDTDYPQIYWATIAGTGQLLTIDQAEDFTPLDSDTTVAVRSAFGIAQDECFPHDTNAGPRVEETVKIVGGKDAWSATCHHPEYAGLVTEGYLHAWALGETGHDFTVKGDVEPGSDRVEDVVSDYVEHALSAAPDRDGDGIADDWERYFLVAPDNCRLTPNPGQADSNANGIGNACDADYNGDGLVGSPDFLLLLQVFGALAEDEDYDARFDADADGEIGASDFAMLIASFGRAPGE